LRAGVPHSLQPHEKPPHDVSHWERRLKIRHDLVAHEATLFPPSLTRLNR